MANRFCVSLTHAKDNSDKATVAFVVANAALGSGKRGRPPVPARLRRRHPRRGVRTTAGTDGELRQGRRHHLRLLPLLQEAQARRESSGGRRGNRRRRKAGGVPVGREPLRQLLASPAWSLSTGISSSPTPASTVGISTAATDCCC